MKTVYYVFFLAFIVLSSTLCGCYGEKSYSPVLVCREISIRWSNSTSEAIEIGEVECSWPYNELVYTGLGYGPEYVYGEGDIWYNKRLFNRSYDVWFVPALAVGDLDPDVEGAEVVEGLYELIVLTYDRTTGNWTNKTIWNPWVEIGECVISLKIGDFDPRHSGNELLCALYAGMVREFYKESNGTWIQEVIDDSRAGIRTYDCDIGNFDPRFDGNECVVFTEENITEYAWNGTGWYNETIVIYSNVPAALWAGRVAELNTTNEVEEIIWGSGWSQVGLVWWDGSGYEVKRIAWDIGGNTRAVAVGDCLSGHPGNEIVAGGTSGIVFLLWEENDVWRKAEIYVKDTWIEDIEIGEFDPMHPGNEIAVGTGWLHEVYENPSVSETTWILQPVLCVVVAVPAILWHYGRRRI